MEYTDYLLWKFGILCVLALLYGIYRGYKGF